MDLLFDWKIMEMGASGRGSTRMVCSTEGGLLEDSERKLGVCRKRKRFLVDSTRRLVGWS